jgi:hypothetical protein
MQEAVTNQFYLTGVDTFIRSAFDERFRILPQIE